MTSEQYYSERLEKVLKYKGGLGAPRLTTPRSDLILAGTDHTADMTKFSSTAPHKDFLSAVRSADHMAMEGNKDSHFYFQAAKPRSYEVLAKRLISNRDIFYLEKGENQIENSAQFGLSAYEVSMYLGIGQLDDFNEAPVRARTLRESATVSVDKLANSLFGFRKEQKPQAIEGMENMQRKIGELVQSGMSRETIASILLDVFHISAWYVRTVDDYLTIVPNALAFMQQRKGKKLIIAGYEHIRSIERALEYGSMPKPLLWRDFVSNVPNQNSRRNFEFFNELAGLGK